MEVTHSRILKISVPIVLANSTVPLLGAVDTFVVGQMASPIPIGAVAVGSLIISVFYWFFGFLRMGTTGLASQAHGAGEAAEVAAILIRVLVIGVFAGCCIFFLQSVLFYVAFKLSPASSEVETLAQSYLEIRVLSAPAAIALFGLSGWLIAQERTRELLLLQLIMNGVNICLDLVFVLSFGWGVAGVAIATVVAELTGITIGLLICRYTLVSLGALTWRIVFDRVKLLRMFTVNVDILLRTLMLEAIIVSFTFLGSRFGDLQLAANQILLQFLLVTAFLLDGFAFAVEALVGQAFGSRNRDALRQSAIMCSHWGLGVVALLSLIFTFLGPSLIQILTNSPEVQLEALRFLPYLIAVPICGLAAWMFDGIFLGATETSVMRNMMLVSVAVYGVSIAVLVPYFGNHGLWLSLLISLCIRGVTLGAHYLALEAKIQN